MRLLPITAALTALGLSLATNPDSAKAAVVLITQEKAVAGNVTNGDEPGFPVTITTPGSYRLETNLRVVSGSLAHAIQVTASEVTLDLNGFRIEGGEFGWMGINGLKRNLTVRNGTIRGFVQSGILIVGAFAVIENMRIEENRGRGILIAGHAGQPPHGFAQIKNNIIYGNGMTGILCWEHDPKQAQPVAPCHVEGNIVANNQQYGIQILSGTVIRNTVSGNRLVGIIGSEKVGYGFNTVLDNGGAIGGNPANPNGSIPGILLGSNACSPQSC